MNGAIGMIHIAVMTLLQLLPLETMEPGSVVELASGQALLRLEVLSSPAPDYWTANAEYRESAKGQARESYAATAFHDGTLDRVFSITQSGSSGTGALFSVNQAGAPLPLPPLADEQGSLWLTQDVQLAAESFVLDNSKIGRQGRSVHSGSGYRVQSQWTVSNRDGTVSVQDIVIDTPGGTARFTAR